MIALLAYLFVALALWAYPAPEIRIHEWDQDSQPESEWAQPDALAWALFADDGSCDIWVWPEHFWYWIDEPARQNVITHEVGHCLGVGHLEGWERPGVMNYLTVLTTGEPTMWDRAEYVRHHGYRLVLPSVVATNYDARCRAMSGPPLSCE